MSTYGCSALHWGSVNPADGVYDWSALDVFVSTAVANGREVCYVLSGCPTWLAQPADAARNDPWGLAGGGSYPTNLSKLSLFCQQLLARYNSVSKKIQYVQLFNEPQFDVTTGYFWGTAQQYVDMLATAYSALTTADSSLVVISAPAITAATEIAWWNAVGPVTGKKGVNCFNAVGTHPYYAVPSLMHSGRGTFGGLSVGGINVLRKQLAQAGRDPVGLKFYATEYGISSNNVDGVVANFFTQTADYRSKYVQRLFISAALSGLETLCLFSYGNTFGNCIGDLVQDPSGVTLGITTAYNALVGKRILSWSVSGSGAFTVNLDDGSTYTA